MSGPHVTIPGSNRPAKADARRVRDADPHVQMEVTISLRGPALPDANHLPARALSSKEFAAQYSASQQDADKVQTVLESYGLKVEEVSLATRSMRVSGTVAAMEKAFQPRLGIYHNAEQGDFRGREGDIKVPAELDGLITAVLGLDQRRVARRKPVVGKGRRPAKPKAPTSAAAPTALAPADLEARYGFPAGDGAEQTIAIAEFGGGYFANDLAAFCTKYHRQTPQVTVVPVDLDPLTLPQIMLLPKPQRLEELGEASEVMMDVEIVASLCPKAAISVYFATFDQKGWVDLLNQVVLARPTTLSVSWGAPEDAADGFSEAARNAINDCLNAAAALGITICVSSGDDGSGDELSDGQAHVDFPSSSPFVLSVGGTMLTGANADEQVWWESPGRRFDDNGNSTGGGATGGGVSTIFPRPQWQNVQIASLNTSSIDGRVIPDVTALAGPPFYDLTFLGHDAPNGGTSASAPLWAALIARINALLPAAKQQRFLTPLLYQAGPDGKPVGASGCRDITQGQNASNPQPGAGYQAGPGFDAASGWGAPIGTRLLELLH